jgi:hypothetical protein
VEERTGSEAFFGGETKAEAVEEEKFGKNRQPGYPVSLSLSFFSSSYAVVLDPQRKIPISSCLLNQSKGKNDKSLQAILRRNSINKQDPFTDSAITDGNLRRCCFSPLILVNELD